MLHVPLAHRLLRVLAAFSLVPLISTGCAHRPLIAPTAELQLRAAKKHDAPGKTFVLHERWQPGGTSLQRGLTVHFGTDGVAELHGLFRDATAGDHLLRLQIRALDAAGQPVITHPGSGGLSLALSESGREIPLAFSFNFPAAKLEQIERVELLTEPAIKP